MIINKLAKSVRLLQALSPAFSQVANTTKSAPVRRQRLQFSKHRLVEFGELPHGQIPEALAVVRPTKVNKLANEIRVCSETWTHNQPCITVLVKAGSRQQNLTNSSVSNFVAHGALCGTSKYSKDKINQLIDSFGGKIAINMNRQLTQYSLFYQPEFLTQAVDLLSEIVLNPTYERVQVQALKATIHKDASSMDPYTISTESVHYTAFRDHYLGQPRLGNKDVVYSITPQQIKEFHSNFYVGKNIVVSGAGDINHDALVNEVSAKFGTVPAARISQVPNSDVPLFTPSLLYQRDDQILNTAFSVAFIAPGWNDPDFFAMNFFKNIIGDYRCDKFTGEHLNSPHLQYNSFHTYLGNYPDMILHKPFYFAYSDVGIFGNFIYGNEMYTQEMSVVTQNQMSVYAQYLNQAQVFRARNNAFNNLLQFNETNQVSQYNAKQLAYIDRLFNRTEIATRISHMTPEYLNKVATKWFWDKETAVTGWGNLHSGMASAHYNRSFKRATLGQYSQMSVHFLY